MKYTSTGGGEGEKRGAWGGGHATGLCFCHHSANQYSVYLDVSSMSVFEPYVKCVYWCAYQPHRCVILCDVNFSPRLK